MASGWLRGVVVEVPSGDTVVIAGGSKPGGPTKRITLSSLIAPRLVGFARDAFSFCYNEYYAAADSVGLRRSRAWW